MALQVMIGRVRDPENIGALCALLPRYMAFDFRHYSPHYIGELDESLLTTITPRISKIGIFDAQSALYMSYIAGRFSLNGVILEGDVPVRTCEMLAAEGLEVIKTVNKSYQIEEYEGVCNKFLIRSASLLETYSSKTPLIVSSELFCDGRGWIAELDWEFEDRVAYKNCKKIENWIKDRV